MPILKGYNYFDTPDYEDCHKKLWFVTKWGLIATHFHAVFEILCYQDPKTVVEMGRLALKRMGPTTGSLMLGSAVQCTVANLRGKKDDHLNYIAGGAAMGVMWGMKLGCSGKGTGIAVGLGLLGLILKEMNRNQFEIFPQLPDHTQELGGQFGMKYGLDWTFGLKAEDPGRRPL